MSNEMLFLSLMIFMAILVAGWFAARRFAWQAATIPQQLNVADWGKIMAQMQQQLETRDIKIVALENEGNQLRIDVSKLRQEIQLWQAKATELQAVLNLFMRQLGENQQRMTALEHEMVTLQAENQRLKQTIIAPGRRETLITRLSADEIRAVCQDIGANYESLEGEGHAAKVVSLLDYVMRRQEMPRLVAAVQRLRSDVVL